MKKIVLTLVALVAVSAPAAACDYAEVRQPVRVQRQVGGYERFERVVVEEVNDHCPAPVVQQVKVREVRRQVRQPVRRQKVREVRVEQVVGY